MKHFIHINSEAVNYNNTMKKFYRVCDEVGGQGLWYKPNGEFVGLIHTRFNFCKNHDLKMDYDRDIVGYLSATDSYDTLMQWFDEDDIRKLQEFGFYIFEYEVTDYWFYEPFKHWVINQETSKQVKKIILL